MSKSKQSINWNNLAVGGGLALIQVSTIGQPFEVCKTHMAANRSDNFRTAIRKTWARGGIAGFYQGLIPWAWIEAGSKGAILMLASREAERAVLRVTPGSNTLAGAAGGVVGGLAQSYLCMGFTTCMKTIDITRSKAAAGGARVPGTIEVFRDILAKEGIRGVNKGVNAVAMRQVTGWASRMGISRFIEDLIRKGTGKTQNQSLSAVEKILASCGGGALSCWNQPFEVLRVEMQSAVPSALHQSGKRPTVWETAKFIYARNGALGFFRGVTPRILLAASATTSMVAGGDIVRKALST
ncbi:mitochondrial carrier domain-containing protein [Pseudohyphozyma bogoriensis]|nr:mitochondrial carrier domain-containing protein [Pseudohyphozyma bogoriensis]